MPGKGIFMSDETVSTLNVEHTGEKTYESDQSAADAAQALSVEKERKGFTGDALVVRTGEANDDSDAANKIDTSKKRRETYDKLIRAYKDLYVEDTQKMINRRFKEFKETKEALESARNEIDRLNEKLRSSSERIPPSEEFLLKHPDFSLEKELENESFSALYELGVSADSAFIAAHFDELVEIEREKARNDAVKATLDSIRAKGTRTRESAALPSSGSVVKRNVSALSKSERAQIARRVMAGENISFS